MYTWWYRISSVVHEKNQKAIIFNTYHKVQKIKLFMLFKSRNEKCIALSTERCSIYWSWLHKNICSNSYNRLFSVSKKKQKKKKKLKQKTSYQGLSEQVGSVVSGKFHGIRLFASLFHGNDEFIVCWSFHIRHNAKKFTVSPLFLKDNDNKKNRKCS